MTLYLWLAFAAASAVLLSLPGPTVLLVVGYAVAHGRRAALATVVGVALGDCTALLASMLGLGALLSTSAMLFQGLRWLGAAYLVYLGIKLWRTPAAAASNDAASTAVSGRRMLLHSFAVTALNPKSIVFFVAFLPQFVNPASPLLPQMAILGTTFLGLAILNAAAYAYGAAAARRGIRRPVVQRAVNRIGGSLLIGAGLIAAIWRRAT